MYLVSFQFSSNRYVFFYNLIQVNMSLSLLLWMLLTYAHDIITKSVNLFSLAIEGFGGHNLTIAQGILWGNC